MEGDSLEHHHQESGRFPIKGMESVIATVTGYHGKERFDLIKLIVRCGASYVGNMSPSITHLVCLKFEGRKYDIAKRLKMKIVNHRWIEECAKEGRLVSVEPYTFQSGEEVGPLCIDISWGIEQARAQARVLKTTKEPVIDIECEDMGNAAWTDSLLFDEVRQNGHCSDRPIRKATKRTSRGDLPSSSKYCLETPSGPSNMMLKEASTSHLAYSPTPKKGNSTSLGPQRRRRRLVKRQTSMEDWLLNPNAVEDHEEIKVLPGNNSSELLPDRSDVENHQSTSNRNAPDIRCVQDNKDARDEVELIGDMNDGNQKASIHGAQSSVLATTKELLEAACENFIDVDHVNKLPASSELSCVICWTDFSSTRGVLPCGHRFCFSCIQNWADHMASSRKPSTCPLCKASFVCITKVDDAISADQKIYSQSIPHDSSKMNLYILPDESYSPGNPSASVCFLCSSREPEDLLVSCRSCDIRCVHSCCLDPPLFPWTCVHCMDLHMIYRQRV